MGLCIETYQHKARHRSADDMDKGTAQGERPAIQGLY